MNEVTFSGKAVIKTIEKISDEYILNDDEVFNTVMDILSYYGLSKKVKNGI